MSTVILEDETIRVEHPREVFTEGHIEISPVHPVLIVEELQEEILTKMFQVANKLSAVLFETLPDCTGTNLLIQNGVPAGQTKQNVTLHLIPRRENDGLELKWESTQVPPSRLQDIESMYQFAEEQEKRQAKKKRSAKKIQQSSKPEKRIHKNDYYAKQLQRRY